MQEIEKNLADAKKIKKETLVRKIERQKENIDYEYKDISSSLEYQKKEQKEAAEQLRVSLEQLKSLGIQGEKEAEQKSQALQKEHSEIEAKISGIEQNKEEYIAQARREIVAMQKPVPSVGQSTKNMVSQVLSSINETDRALQKEKRQERFAASLFGSSFLEPKNRRIIGDFLLSRAS